MKLKWIFIPLILGFVLTGCITVQNQSTAAITANQAPAGEIAIGQHSPSSWEKAELSKYQLLNRSYGKPVPLVRNRGAMIAGTTGPIAIHAGRKILDAGGTAADAIITTSLAQIALTGGSWNSYAGIFHMVYYEKKSGKVYSLNAGYNGVKGETDPGTIPKPPTPIRRAGRAPLRLNFRE